MSAGDNLRIRALPGHRAASAFVSAVSAAASFCLFISEASFSTAAFASCNSDCACDRFSSAINMSGPIRYCRSSVAETNASFASCIACSALAIAAGDESAARFASACLYSKVRVVSFCRASTCPVSTVSPRLTSTSLTRPLFLNPNETSSAGMSVPMPGGRQDDIPGADGSRFYGPIIVIWGLRCSVSVIACSRHTDHDRNDQSGSPFVFC